MKCDLCSKEIEVNNTKNGLPNYLTFFTDNREVNICCDCITDLDSKSDEELFN